MTQTYSLRFSYVLALLLVFTFPFQVLALEGSEEEIPILDNPLTASAKLLPGKIAPGGTSELVIDMEIAEHYRAYVEQFKLKTDSTLKVADHKLSPIVQFMDTFSKKMKDGVEGKSQLKAIVEAPLDMKPGQQEATFQLTYQACTKRHCLFPKTISVTASFEVVNDGTALTGLDTGPGETTAAASTGAGDSTGFADALGKGLFITFLFVFLAGFATSLTPCVYPMIPITLSILGARAKGQSKAKSFSLSFVYVLGIAFTYSLLGVAAAQGGMMFGSALGNVWVVSAIAMLFVAMGLSMYGLFEIQAPAFVRNKVGSAQAGSGYAGSFFTGLIAGVVASPCIGPVLVAVLAYISQTKNPVLGFFLLFTFAMGMGILFMVLGTFSSLIGKVPKGGSWMEVVKFSFGTMMVGMALYYVAPVYPKPVFYGLLGLALILISSFYGAFEPSSNLSPAGRLRKGLMLSSFVLGLAYALVAALGTAGLPMMTAGGPALMAGAQQPAAKLNWQPLTESNLQAAIASGKPVLIDFYADWCGACKELEQITFTDPTFLAESEKFALLKYDATKETPEFAQWRNKYEIRGLPWMVFYDVGGQHRPELTVTGFLEAAPFVDLMKKAQSSGNLRSPSAAVGP